ncbi:hypothetical protein F5X96DRAFT_625501 [Biscogniauxia mediterranea]|nr:hypothetical protein F5X96DRAFT_625501 [Biscogniauxia mediterranea]
MAAGSQTQSDAAPELADMFEDFDLPEVFRKAQENATSKNSKNFVVEFGSDHARIAFDLGAEHFLELLKDGRDTAHYPIRWINIWDPNVQKETLVAIGDKYDFSERLVGLMMTVTKPPPHEDRKRKDWLAGVHLRHHRSAKDLEKGNGGDGSIAMRTVSNTPVAIEDSKLALDDDSMSLYLQVKNTVNYFSTDHTRKAMCIGAHWLHQRPRRENEPERKSITPPKHWQWLTLCNDHTVLSIHEEPSYEPTPPGEDEQAWQEDELRSIRSNTLNVLLQLSKLGFDLKKKKPLSMNSVRRPLSRWVTDRPDLNRHETGMSFASNGEPVGLADEGTSNLFYYLFEDYEAAGPFKIAERKLEEMTHKVLESARPKVSSKSTDIIPTLHYLSKDLRELKHLFENYRNLVGKIMASGQPEAHARPHSYPHGYAPAYRKVALTYSALSRFERLGDRLQFLMLNTIEGYLEEINALSSTYFNLTQQKDSAATARLTRSATLLAKLSVFFLPISFMTSYFSVQIEDLYATWRGTDYWYSFAVIASVSFVCLFFFSRLLMFCSDVMDDWAMQIGRWFRRMFRVVGLNLNLRVEED